LEVRATLDGLATALAAERITDEEIKELEHVHSQFLNYANKDNLQGSIKKDVEFHELIYRHPGTRGLFRLQTIYASRFSASG